MDFTKSKELRCSKILLHSFYPGFSRKAALFFKEQRNVKLFVVRTDAQRGLHSVTPHCCSASSKKERERKNTTSKNISILT